MKHRQVLFAILLLLLTFELYAQKAKFIYETDFCECTGVFDSTKYSRTQLQNTLRLLWYAPIIETDATAFTLAKVSELSPDKLDAECSKRLKELNTLEFVDTDFWRQIKADRIREIENTCLLRKFTLAAWKNPDTLRYYDLVDNTCIFYRNALIQGGDELIQAWSQLNVTMKSKNANPDKLQRKFDQQLNSTDKFEYARLEVMTFGWWNSANHLIFHLNQSGDFETEFEKLFIKVKCECDEP